MNTKERIANEARKLFSIKGYEGTSVRDIAKSVGIKDSSLYNHYKSKKAIFDYIIEDHLKISNEEFLDFYRDNKYDDKSIIITASITIFKALLDTCVMETRRMLTMEMYQNEEYKVIYHDLFFKEPYSWCEKIFSELIENKVIVNERKDILFYKFYSPIFMLILECDLKEYREEDMISRVIECGKAFIKEYGKE